MEYNSKQFLVTLLCGSFCCILVGFLFFQTKIFNFGMPTFIFVALGFTGSVIYSTLKYRSTKESIIFTAGLLILEMIFGKTKIFSVFFRDFILFSSFWACIYFYEKRLEQFLRYKYLRAFGLGIAAAIILLLAGLVLVLINVSFNFITVELIYRLAYTYLQFGMLIGLGLGLGFELSGYLLDINRTKGK